LVRGSRVGAGCSAGPRLGVWDQLKQVVLDEFGQVGMIDRSRGCLDSVNVRAKRGDLTGADPTDRGKLGAKYHILTAGDGLPLHIELSGANRYDSMLVELVLDNVAPIKGVGPGPAAARSSSTPTRPTTTDPSVFSLRKRGILAHIAEVASNPQNNLGKHRWVIERTMAWMHSYQKLTHATTEQNSPSPAPDNSPKTTSEIIF